MEIHDRSVIEAASWRLASELMRRHPTGARLFRGHPGGGQYDVLWIKEVGADGMAVDGGNIPMNRNGTIQVHGQFREVPGRDWEPTGWDEYLAAEPKEFLERLERAAGWAAPKQVPAATPTTLTYRLLAAMTAGSMKSLHPITIEMGYVDTSGYGGGSNTLLRQFTLPDSITALRPDDWFEDPGYRFWIPCRDGKPLMLIEQTSAQVWFPGEVAAVDAMWLFRKFGRDAAVTAHDLLRRSKT